MMVHEVVAVFKDTKSLQNAIDELQNEGFDRSDLSLLASEDVIEGKLGHIYSRVTDLEDDPDAPTIAYISPEALADVKGALIGTPMYFAALLTTGVMTVAGGPLAATIAAVAAAGGAGALLGGILTTFVDKHHAEYIEKQLDHGGLLLWVHTRDSKHEAKAKRILSEYSAHDIHVHRKNVASN